MRDHQDRLDRDPPLLPEVEEVGAQGLGGQHVERRERLVHQQDFRLHDQRAGEADALPHTARQLLRIGGLEAIEADRVDRLQGALPGLIERHAVGPGARFPRCRARSATGRARSSETPSRLPRPDPSPACPEIVTLPDVGRVRPEMSRRRVDLPEPERPSSATISPLFGGSSKRFRARACGSRPTRWRRPGSRSGRSGALHQRCRAWAILDEGAVRGAAAARHTHRAGARTGG